MTALDVLRHTPYANGSWFRCELQIARQIFSNPVVLRKRQDDVRTICNVLEELGFVESVRIELTQRSTACGYRRTQKGEDWLRSKGI